ncbi:MAG: hypothetical protein HQ582_22830 [Planctomycetes bacterium]|nr:hypothetical protein [Planctomycetota bacterium]
MYGRIGTLAVMALAIASPAAAGEAAAVVTERYRVAPVEIPDEDLSGPLGPRCLRLLSDQVSRNLTVMEADRKKAGIEDPRAIVSDGPYFEYFVAGSAYAAAVLVRWGEPGETMGGLAREELLKRAVEMIQAVARDHHLGGGSKRWSTFRSARIIHVLGMAAWLLWEELERPAQLLVARIMEHEADRFLDRPAPARLHGDTQAESNAWTGGGIAVAACMLRSHPHRQRWAEKANEYMISAYATAGDVASSEVVDGKPLKEWLTAPNASADYTIENHGLVHPDYLGAISEMVRSAISFRLAGEPVPQAVTFNAEEVLDLLVFLYLPDGTELYPQNTDYTPRRLDVFLQAAGIVPHKPDPARKACLLRTLAGVEKMAAECPGIPMNGWIGFPYDLGSTWGLTQNYLTLRFFGDGGKALSDDRLETELAGLFASEPGRFVVHRTPSTISSFSWRSTGKRPPVMGLTMPLDKDVLCYPMPWGYIGQVRELGQPAVLKVHSHRLAVCDDGFAVTVDLGWCADKVRQRSAFVSLPNGWSVYLEERRAAADVAIELATSGDVTFFDDPRWVYQARPRAFFGEQGSLKPDRDRFNEGTWVNVDDRLGYAVVESGRFRLVAAPGRPCIWRGDGTMYNTCRVEFVHVAPPPAGKTALVSFRAGDLINRFGIVSCPNQSRQETAALGRRLGRAGWHVAKDGVLALVLDRYLVYANFSPRAESVLDGREAVTLPAKTTGWVTRSFSSDLL